MPRLPPRTETLRALFARSGNLCAFPGCTSILINERNQFIAQVCHIEAAEVGGERYDPLQSDEQRRSYDNLVLLCYPHHIETNDVALYPAERLRTMKQAHERAFGQKLFQIDEALLHKVSAEMAAYWDNIDRLHREHHIASDLAIEVKAHATYLEVSDRAVELVEDLSRLQQYLVESDTRRIEEDSSPGSAHTSPRPNDFEVLYIGFTNTITKLSIALVQLEIRYLEEFVKLNPSDLGARERLEKRKVELAEYATSAGHAD